MKSRTLVSATPALGAIALAGPVGGQNVPAEFVVSGPVAEKIQDFTTINLVTARRIAEVREQIAEPTSARCARIRNDPSGAPRSAVWFNLFSAPGGMPIVVDGQTIGAIGVGGGAGDGDENCAVEGLKGASGDRIAVAVYRQHVTNRRGQ